MKSWTIRFDNGRAVMERRESPPPRAQAGELLVKVRASSLNRGELIAGLGLHGAAPDPKPAGGEASGVVEAVGEGVAGFAPGDRVMGRAKGAFAEYAVMDAREAMHVPASLSFEAAAAVPLVFLVTYDMLAEQGALQKGEWLLITAVSSGVGVACAQLGRMLGAKLIGTSGSADKLARLDLDVAIPTRKPDFAGQVLEATAGKGANLAVNALGGSVFAELVRAMAYRGRIAIVGYVDGRTTSEIDLDAVHARRLKIFGVSNKMRSAPERAGTVQAFVRDVLPAFADGRIKPVIDKVFPMDELPAAVAYMNSDAQLGKIVVSV
ncbi:MAG: zinc-binding alcohol dehydrogenase [Betaproteobacteria bacterium]|nr:zinc-binding alcohol dehydrogenase [Betaproteobacteria bacterium]